jgi:folate-binding protein YgfZ
MQFAPTPLPRDVLRLTGEETLPFLQGLLTCNVATMTAGELRYGALLTPQGKILDTMFLTRTEDALFIDVAAGRGEALLKRLSLYRLRARIEITAAPELVVHAAPDGIPEDAIGGGPDPRLPTLGTRWIAEGMPDDDAAEAYEAALIAAGVPDFGFAFSEAEVFPLGVNLDALHGIDHKKGCFVGQEVASRMFRKGEIRKRTWRVEGAHLEVGQTLTRDSRSVGTVTATAGDIGLAAIRRDLTGDETPQTVETEHGPATLVRPDYLA